MILKLSDCWYWFVLTAVVCYFIGNVNFAVIIAKSRHKDVRAMGSGNPGTMNISREFGLKIGLLNFFLDAFKGGLPVLAVYFIFRKYYFASGDVNVADFARYLAGAFVIIGHVFPAVMKFKGGKGIASTFGVFWFGLGCENPWYYLIVTAALILIVVFIGVTEMGSMGSLLGVSAFSLWQGMQFYSSYSYLFARGYNGYVIVMFMLLLLINFLTWFSHRKNLVRLFAGEEHRTSVKKLHHGKRGMENM